MGRSTLTRLGADERARIKDIAAGRYIQGSRSGQQKGWRPDEIHDPKMRHDPERQEGEGVIGEIVCERVLPVRLNTVYGDSDRGIDFTFVDGPWRGRTGDAKFTRSPGGVLFFNNLDEFRADLAVLVAPFVHCEWQIYPESHVYQLIGFITREEFLRHHTSRDLGYGPRVCVDQSLLRSVEMLR